MTYRKISGSSSENTWLMVARTSASGNQAPVVAKIRIEQLHVRDYRRMFTSPSHRLPGRCYARYRYSTSPVQIALFAERDPDVPGGLATTVAGLLDHRPHDIHVVPFLHPPVLSSLLRVNEVVRQLIEHHIELVHITTAGPLALTALGVAARLQLPVVGSFDIDFLTATAIRRRYLRTLLGLCDKVLVPSACARDTMHGFTAPENVVMWRPGVDIETFAPSKRSESLRDRWQISDEPHSCCLCGHIIGSARCGPPPVAGARVAPKPPDAPAHRGGRRSRVVRASLSLCRCGLPRSRARRPDARGARISRSPDIAE